MALKRRASAVSAGMDAWRAREPRMALGSLTKAGMATACFLVGEGTGRGVLSRGGELGDSIRARAGGQVLVKRGEGTGASW